MLYYSLGAEDSRLASLLIVSLNSIIKLVIDSYNVSSIFVS
jgi:hypothetical protein